MMGTKQILKDGDEVDVIFAKHYYCYTERAGVSHAIKKRLARRRRREAKQELRE